MNFRPIYKFFLFIFFINFLLLIFIGQAVVEEPFITLGKKNSLTFNIIEKNYIL